MPWYYNTRTGVSWEIEGEREVEIAELHDDLVEVAGPDDKPISNINAASDGLEQQEGATEGSVDPLDLMDKNELRALAKSMNITVTGKTMVRLKADIREAE